MKKYTTADRLKQIMQDKNLRQVDIIEMAQPYCNRFRVKLGKSDLSQFINGKVEPGQWKLTILSLALDVSEAWLMGYDVPMQRTDIDNSEIPNDEELDTIKSFLTLRKKDEASPYAAVVAYDGQGVKAEPMTKEEADLVHDFLVAIRKRRESEAKD